MIRIQHKPLLDDSDINQISALASRDTTSFLRMFRTIAIKLAAYQMEADSLVATDGSGTLIFGLGSNGDTMIRDMKTVWTEDAIGFGTVTNEIMAYAGRGVLRQIAVVVTAGIGGAPASHIASSVFGANIPLITGGVFSPEIVARASRIQGTGAAIGDLVVLDFATEFNSLLKIDHVGTIAGTGAAVIYVWYDKIG